MLTKEQKLEAYKYALKAISEMTDVNGTGICHQLRSFLIDIDHKESYRYEIMDLFPELTAMRPKNADPHLWWWRKSPDGYKKRRAALRKIISDLS